MEFFSRHLSRIQERLDAYVASSPSHSPQERWCAIGGMAMLIGVAGMLYQTSHVAFSQFVFATPTIRALLQEACEGVHGCEKAELRMVYLRDQSDWQKQLVVSGKNVGAEAVGAALIEIVERDVRSPVYRGALLNAHPIKNRGM